MQARLLLALRRLCHRSYLAINHSVPLISSSPYPQAVRKATPLYYSQSLQPHVLCSPDGLHFTMFRSGVLIEEASHVPEVRRAAQTSLVISRSARYATCAWVKGLGSILLLTPLARHLLPHCPRRHARHALDTRQCFLHTSISVSNCTSPLPSPFEARGAFVPLSPHLQRHRCAPAGKSDAERWISIATRQQRQCQLSSR